MARQDENSPSGAVSSDSPRPTRISVDLAPEQLVKVCPIHHVLKQNVTRKI